MYNVLGIKLDIEDKIVTTLPLSLQDHIESNLVAVGAWRGERGSLMIDIYMYS